MLSPARSDAPEPARTRAELRRHPALDGLRGYALLLVLFLKSESTQMVLDKFLWAEISDDGG